MNVCLIAFTLPVTTLSCVVGFLDLKLLFLIISLFIDNNVIFSCFHVDRRFALRQFLLCKLQSGQLCIRFKLCTKIRNVIVILC